MAELAGMTERIARGEAQAFIPYGERQDEIGALARSMALFRDAMRRNTELDQAVSGETEARARRQTQMINEVASFSSEFEATLAELGRIPRPHAGRLRQARERGARCECEDVPRRSGLCGSVPEGARHRLRGRRAFRLGERDRPAGHASAATQETARSVEIAARRTAETTGEVGLVGQATQDTRSSAGTVKQVADDLGQVAGRMRAQVDEFFERLSA